MPRFCVLLSLFGLVLFSVGCSPDPGLHATDTPAAPATEAVRQSSPVLVTDEPPVPVYEVPFPVAVSVLPVWMPRGVTQWEAYIVDSATRWGGDPSLVAIVMLISSGGDPHAHSEAGAVGLMQLMPVTAEDIVNMQGLKGYTPKQLFDPRLNVDFGAYYLSHQLRSFRDPAYTEEQMVGLAAAAYSGGPGTVLKYLEGAPLPPEVTRFQAFVVGMWRERSDAISPTFDAWSQQGVYGRLPDFSGLIGTIPLGR